MDALASALGVAALALFAKVLYDLWHHWLERRGIAAALAGEIGAYITLLRPQTTAASLRTIATMGHADRVKALRAMAVPPIGHPVFDKVAHRIGLLSAQNALEVSAFYNVATGFRLHMANMSSDKFLEGPEAMQVTTLQYLAKAIEDEAPKVLLLVERLRRSKMKTITIVLALVLFSAPSGAQNSTHDDFKAGTLYATCFVAASKPGDEADVACTTYMRGITDGIWMMQMMANDHTPTCTPENTPISVADARRAFKQWVDAHPEQQTHSAGLVAAWALVAAYKCR